MALAIKNLVDSLLKKQDDWRINLLQNWQTIIGALHNRIRLERIADNTVVIGVYESHWMQELYLLQRCILTSINKHLDQPRVVQLKFKLVEQKKPKEPVKHISIPQAIVMPVVLTFEQKKALCLIKDEQLRSYLTTYLSRCKAEH